MSGQITRFDAIPLMIPNDVLVRKDFYISYNNRDIGVYGSETTALVIGNMEKFLVLDGNHAKAYLEFREDLHACIDYFKRNISLVNKFSDAV